jgi:hypothetical protein
MTSDNITPFENRRVMREEIDRQWEIPVDTYGEDHIEVMAIAESWGDTMDDEEVLAALRKLNSTGPYSTTSPFGSTDSDVNPTEEAISVHRPRD